MLPDKGIKNVMKVFSVLWLQDELGSCPLDPYALTLRYQSKALITTVSSADVMHLSAGYYLKYTLRRDYVVLTQNLLF